MIPTILAVALIAAGPVLVWLKVRRDHKRTDRGTYEPTCDCGETAWLRGDAS